MSDKKVFAVVCGIELTDAKSVGSVSAILDGASAGSVGAYAEILGTAPTYDQWEAARVAWREGYCAQREKLPTDAALNMAWSRFAARLKEAHGLEKPKSTSKDATKQRAARVTPATVEEAVAKANEARAAAAAPDASKEVIQAAAKAVGMASRMQAAAEKEAAKVEDERLKGRRSAMVERVKAADAQALVLVESVFLMLAEGTPDDVKRSAWSVLSFLNPQREEHPAPVQTVGRTRRA